jgi:putative component of membrane protein insertase Oxa1/YidC/SpoIIIJ protein YidD
MSQTCQENYYSQPSYLHYRYTNHKSQYVAFAALGLFSSLFISSKKLSRTHQITKTGLDLLRSQRENRKGQQGAEKAAGDVV